ncbi:MULTISPECIES: hypothetical protein [Helicobacter]|uniref:Uncharacterized protein n=2 Tax=Helicobacter ganmani TaxID=60246 RepID=A0A3D8IFM8_9HELI|nr:MULTISPECIES: hypothetical protein [Helicobacter]RDU63795.1 hypothetical protein CQA43_02945 [Helicobacter ganmani]
MKFVSSVLVSFMLVFLLFAVFWATIFSGYIQYYGIKVFFNPFFFNVFNIYAFIFFVAIFGIGFVIPFVDKVFKFLFVVLLGCAILLFIPNFGRAMGEIFLAKDYTLNIQGEMRNIHGLYEDRHYIVYLSEDSEDFETRKRNLVYYEKPNAE